MGWRLKVCGILMLMGLLSAAARSDELKPPDYLAELKASRDTTTVRPPSVGFVLGGKLATPMGGRGFRIDVSRTQSLSIGLFWRSKLEKADVLSYIGAVSFYYERQTADPEEIVDHYRPILDLPDGPYQASGGERGITGVLIENLIAAPWIERPFIPYVTVIVGAGYYTVDDLRVEWEDLIFRYYGEDEWVVIFGGAFGLIHDFGPRNFIALELRAQGYGSLEDESDYVDTPAQPTHPRETTSTPIEIGVRLTVGVGVF